MLLHREVYIKMLKDKLHSEAPEPNSEETVAAYTKSGINPFVFSCVNGSVNGIEKGRLLFAIAALKKVAHFVKRYNSERLLVLETMAGCGRNIVCMREEFKDCRVVINDVASEMLDYAVEHQSIARAHTRCCRVQDLNWGEFRGDVAILLAWWNLCYLNEQDIDDYLN